MEARHCAGAEMQDMMGYAACVGRRRRGRGGRRGFVGTATDATAHLFGATRGRGTMPHALIGYAGSTLRAAEMFHETFPEREPDRADRLFRPGGHGRPRGLPPLPRPRRGRQLAVRLDTHGGRFLEGLDPAESYAVLERHAPGAIRRYRSDAELRYLVGTGVSAAAIWRMREALDEAGFKRCGSSPPPASAWRNAASWRTPRRRSTSSAPAASSPILAETYATADIVAYGNEVG